MEREEAYRKRLNDVKTEVRRRLEYQLLMESLHKEFEKRHLVSWLKDNVQAALVNKQVKWHLYSKPVYSGHVFDQLNSCFIEKTNVWIS